MCGFLICFRFLHLSYGNTEMQTLMLRLGNWRHRWLSFDTKGYLPQEARTVWWRWTLRWPKLNESVSPSWLHLYNPWVWLKCTTYMPTSVTTQWANVPNHSKVYRSMSRHLTAFRLPPQYLHSDPNDTSTQVASGGVVPNKWWWKWKAQTKE